MNGELAWLCHRSLRARVGLSSPVPETGGRLAQDGLFFTILDWGHSESSEMKDLLPLITKKRSPCLVILIRKDSVDPVSVIQLIVIVLWGFSHHSRCRNRTNKCPCTDRFFPHRKPSTLSITKLYFLLSSNFHTTIPPKIVPLLLTFPCLANPGWLVVRNNHTTC